VLGRKRHNRPEHPIPSSGDDLGGSKRGGLALGSKPNTKTRVHKVERSL